MHANCYDAAGELGSLGLHLAHDIWPGLLCHGDDAGRSFQVCVWGLGHAGSSDVPGKPAGACRQQSNSQAGYILLGSVLLILWRVQTDDVSPDKTGGPDHSKKHQRKVMVAYLRQHLRP
eukprot:1157798-Pelagomonas_calceolata.AAC.3